MTGEGHRDEGQRDAFATPDWLDDGPAERRRTRVAVVAAIATVPWLLVGVVLLGARTPPPPPAAPDLASVPATAGVAPDPAVDTGAPVDAAAAPVSPTPPVEADRAPDIDAVALVTARAWAGGDGAPLDLPAVGSSGLVGYVEHLAVERVDQPAPGLAVATLLAVVLRPVDGVYGTAELRRLAVPLAIGPEGAHPGGTPWWLPGPDLTAAPPDTVTIVDPDLTLAATTALTTAGYGDVRDVTVAGTEGAVVVVEATATAPGEGSPTTHRLWLLPDRGGLVVAGRGVTAVAGSGSEIPTEGAP